MNRRGILQRLVRSTCGAAAAEFALVLPTFVVLVFGTINAGLAMSAITQVHYAAERSARCLSVDAAATCTSGNIDTFAKGFYHGPAVTGLTFAASTAACGNRVIGSGSYQILTGFQAFSITINSTACYPVI